MLTLLLNAALVLVGGFLVGKLVDRDFEVWGADRDTDAGFAGKHQLAVDLTDEESVGAMLEKSRPDFIVHLAAQSHVKQSFDEPVKTILNNTLPILYILDRLKDGSTACRMLAVGSADEYGPVEDVFSILGHLISGYLTMKRGGKLHH